MCKHVQTRKHVITYFSRFVDDVNPASNDTPANRSSEWLGHVGPALALKTAAEPELQRRTTVTWVTLMLPVGVHLQGPLAIERIQGTENLVTSYRNNRKKVIQCPSLLVLDQNPHKAFVDSARPLADVQNPHGQSSPSPVAR